MPNFCAICIICVQTKVFFLFSMALAISWLETGKPPTHNLVVDGAMPNAWQVTLAAPKQNNEVVNDEKN